MVHVERTVRPDPPALAEWDRLVESTDGGDVVQLPVWAQVRRQAGFRPAYVLARDAGRIVGGAQVLLRRVRGLGTIGYVPYGPLVGAGVDRDAVRTALADALAAVAAGTRMFFVQPPLGADDVSGELVRRGFRGSEAEIAPPATLRLPLAVPDAELLARVSRRTRTWTRQWRNRGVHVHVGGRDDVPLLARLLATSARHHGFTPLPGDYLRRMYDLLAPSGRAVILVGEVQGCPAAAELFTACGPVLTSRLCGFDRGETTARLNVPGAVSWEAICWARSRGFSDLDFGGLSSDSVRMLDDEPGCDPLRFDGPDRAKAKFGGRVVRYPAAVERIPSPLVRAAYDGMRRNPGGRRVLAAARRAMRGLTPRRAAPESVPDAVKRSPPDGRAPARDGVTGAAAEVRGPGARSRTDGTAG